MKRSAPTVPLDVRLMNISALTLAALAALMIILTVGWWGLQQPVFGLTRITVIGAAYLAVVCLIPEWVTASTGVGLALGGTSLLILVNVTIDTVSQMQGHLMAHQYADLIKKAKLKGRMR